MSVDDAGAVADGHVDPDDVGAEADGRVVPDDAGAVSDGHVVPDDAWLVVVDMQEVFTGGSPWATPRYDHAAAGVERLLPRFVGRTVFTRFVAPERPQGSWVPYYRDWPFALVPASDPLWDLTEPFRTAAADRDDPVVTETTFGKWGTRLLAVTGDHPHLVVVGVSTDCCVLSTALAAADAGATVTVVAEACAGASDADHARALDAMRLYAPLITVVDALPARSTAG